MKYLKQEITSFTSSNITEAVSSWSSVTAYTAGQFSLFGTYIYKAVSANTNKSPDTNEGIYWVKWQISNKFAMLDLSAQSKSYVTGGNLTVEFLQNRMESIVLGNYDADYVKIEALDVDSTTVLWTYQTESSVNINVIDYYSYMYEPYGYIVDRAIMINIPLFAYKIRATFYKSSESTESACGFLIGGFPITMGETLSDINFNFNSYAVKDIDAFGSLSVTKRAVQDIVDFETVIPSIEIQNFRREIKKVYNDIICFIVDDTEVSTYENLITLGIIESASVVLSEFDKTTMTFSILEAI